MAQKNIATVCFIASILVVVHEMWLTYRCGQKEIKPNYRLKNTQNKVCGVMYLDFRYASKQLIKQNVG